MKHMKSKGHSLLETLVATGIFVLVSVAMSGVWVVYGDAMAKSGGHLAANHLARGMTEGLIANGYAWLEKQVIDGVPMPVEENYPVLRRVRARQADINFNVLYELVLNTDPDPTNGDTGDRPIAPYSSEDICKITVTVRWMSKRGSQTDAGSAYNNSVTYSTYVYKDAI